MNTSQNPTILSKLFALFGRDERPETEENLERAGARDGTLTMSKEPTGEEVSRVASEKLDAKRKSN